VDILVSFELIDCERVFLKNTGRCAGGGHEKGGLKAPFFVKNLIVQKLVLAFLLFPIVFVATWMALGSHASTFVIIDPIMDGFHPSALFVREHGLSSPTGFD
jgi:hypothetical protein